MNTVPQKICIATTNKSPIHATVLKNVIPLSIKSTQTSVNNTNSMTSTYTINCNTLVSTSAPSVCTFNSNTTNVIPTVSSTSLASIASTSSVIAISSNSPSQKLANNISQIVQSSTGKQVILTSSSHLSSTALNKNQSTANTG